MSDSRTHIVQSYILSYRGHKPQSHTFRLSYLLRFFCVGICIARIVQMIVGIIGFIIPIHYIQKSFVPFIESKGFLTLILFVTCIGPILEEIIFRIWLRPNIYTLSLSVGIIIAYCLSYFFSLSFVCFIVTIISAILIMYFILYHCKKDIIKLDRLISDRWIYIFCIQALIFGLVHIMNFSLVSPRWVSCILVLPQILLGTMLGFERTYFSWRVNILHHMLHNMFLFLPLIFMYCMGYNMVDVMGDISILQKLPVSYGLQLFLMRYGVINIVVLIAGIKSLIPFFTLMRAGKQNS